MDRIAILLDLDNIKPKLEELETICLEYGKIVVRRAFSNTPSVLTAYGSSFRKLDYRFELTPGLTPIAQEVDHLIFATAEELINNSKLEINLVAIVSNDNDYARLFNKLKTQKIKSLVIGNQVGNKARETANYVKIIKDVMRPKFVGIDLGTTNTVMSLANYNPMSKEWKAAVLEVPVIDDNGSLVQNSMIPSSVRFNSSQKSEIGGHIKKNAYAFRDQTILAWKHNMGVSHEGKAFSYQLTSGAVLPEQAASQVLGFCRHQLREKYGEVQGAVITHPASYESDAIEATRKAAVLAGWQEEEIVLLSEPQAALYDCLYSMQRGAIPLAFDVNVASNILVYDLGGGTLDVTLHQVQWDEPSDKFIVNDLAIGSRTRVGGDLVDQFIANYMLENVINQHNLSSGDRDKLSYELPIYAEKFKRLWTGEYSFTDDKDNFKCVFQGVFLDDNLPVRHYISAKKMRHILEALLCADLSLEILKEMNPETAFNESPFTDRFNTFIVPILDVLLKAKASLGKLPEVDAILLNGGMTYFPPIKERLRELFGNIPIINDANPDLAVAKGASLYAAGALKSVERVNPTNIYLETKKNGEIELRLLVAQGQKYPYKTTIEKEFKLPDKHEGNLFFNIWVGMGTKINLNTNLQRMRQVSLNKIFAANLKSGDKLDLEIEYTFDERLLLTLVSQHNKNARFKVEVASENNDIIDVTNSTSININSHQNKIDSKSLIPHISRERIGREIDPKVRINFQDWEELAVKLDHNWSNRKAHERRHTLTQQTAVAVNRSQIIDDFMRWLEIDSFWGSSFNSIKPLMAVLSLGEIFSAINPEKYPQIKNSESKFQQWIHLKINQDLSRIDRQLYDAIGNLPGKLLWPGFDLKLIEAFKCFQREPRSLVFLNSLGKCGQCNSNNLHFLRNVIKTIPHFAQKEKATWALTRLISPGQPEEYRIDFSQVGEIARFLLEQLNHVEHKAQVATMMLACLSQCLAWQAFDYELSPTICREIEKLPTKDLPVYNNLSSVPQIEENFEIRLALLPKMLNFATISQEDSAQIEKLLLESIKET